MRTRENGDTYQHQGQDVAASSGTPVYAEYDGTVQKASNTGGGEGLSIVIQSDSNHSETTSYWHLSEADVTVGEHVTGGQQIGLSGTSGNADPARSGREAHLHVRKQENGHDVNPNIVPQ